jgi:serine/threonine-protein kinase
MDFIQKHVVEPPIPLNDRVPGLKFPRDLEEVIAKALAKDPKDRYQSAIEFAAALRPLAGDASAVVDSIFQMTPAPPSAAASSGSGTSAAASGSGPSMKLLAAVAVVCLVFGVVLAVVIMKTIGK